MPQKDPSYKLPDPTYTNLEEMVALQKLAKAPAAGRGTGYQAPTYYPDERYGNDDWARHDVHHPAGTPTGLAEHLIKMIGSRTLLIPEDLIYLEQYLHPETDILPKTTERPTQATPHPELTYRHLPPSEQTPSLHQMRDNSLYMALGNRGAGLGNFTSSKAPGYASVYDIWDFEGGLSQEDSPDYTEAHPWYSQPAAWAMRQLGTPYAIYERFPSGTYEDDTGRPDLTDEATDDSLIIPSAPQHKARSRFYPPVSYPQLNGVKY